MSDIPKLTLAFLEKRPLEAARVLELLPPENASAFFQEIPLKNCSKVFEEFLPEYAALCFKIAPPVFTSTLIQELPLAKSSAILRLMPDLAGKAILAFLPEKIRNALSKQLAYPRNTVGAWMDSKAIELPGKLTIGEARKFLRRTGKKIDQQIFVINKNGVLEGMVGLSTLAIAKDSLPISQILNRNITPISDRASLPKIRSMKAWNESDALPIVNKKGKFLGVLRKSSLDKAFSSDTNSSSSLELNSILMNLAKTYTSTLSRLVEFMMSTLEKPSKKKKHGI